MPRSREQAEEQVKIPLIQLQSSFGQLLGLLPASWPASEPTPAPGTEPASCSLACSWACSCSCWLLALISQMCIEMCLDFLLTFSVASANFKAGYVINGEDAEITDWPFIASLQTTSGFHFCGGVLYDATHVYTATHCVDGISP